MDEPIAPKPARPRFERANLHRIVEALLRAKPSSTDDSFTISGLGGHEVDAMRRLVWEAIEDGR